MHKHVVFALLRLQTDTRYRLKIILPTHNPYENNLCHIVSQILSEDHDYWLSFDADNPPMNNPLDLVELDKDIIICPTPQWHTTRESIEKGDYPIFWNCMDAVEGGFREHAEKSGLQEIDAGGSGCMLVSRRVLEQIAKPFYRTTYHDGTVEQGPDFTFCMRAKAAGFRVWAHYDYPCRHFKEVELTEAIQAFGAVSCGFD